MVCLASALQTAPAPRVQVSDGVAKALLIQAVLGAQARLGRPACREVLTDFQDGSGRPLADRLREADLTASDYLVQQVWFVDGDDSTTCRHRRDVAAFTEPNSHVVRVCSSRFVASYARQAAAAEMMVIHEMLHTLGLGENPPSSSAITAQVTKRCR